MRLHEMVVAGAAALVVAGCGGNEAPGGSGDCQSCPVSVTSVSELDAVAGTGQVELAWLVPGDATGVMIRRDTTGWPETPTSGTQVYDGSGTSFTDTDVDNFTEYHYAAFAHDSKGNFAPDRAKATATPSFAAVSALKAGAAPGQVSLGWSIPVGATSVTIRRDTASFPETAASGVLVYEGTATTFVDTSLVDYTLYRYAAFSRDAKEVPNPQAATRWSRPPGWAKVVGGGGTHSLGLKRDGSLWAWGSNSGGQLGIGAASPDTCTDYSNSGSTPTPCARVPMRVGTATHWNVVAAGSAHSLGLQKDGTLWAWGSNLNGQLGVGSAPMEVTPKQVGTATNWSAIAGSLHSLALKSDGTLWSWGSGGFGELGLGATGDVGVPSQVPTGSSATWTAIAAGGSHSLALQSDGTLWAWGRNTSGQLGDGTTTNGNAPKKIGAATDWSAVAAGDYHSLALKSDGTLWAWGDNSKGQLGDGGSAGSPTPKQIAGTWSRIVAGGSHSLALKSDGTLWSWGSDSVGQLGNGAAPAESTPKPVGTSTWETLSAGQLHSLGVQPDGTLWAWGWNSYGQVGNETVGSFPSPTEVP